MPTRRAYSLRRQRFIKRATYVITTTRFHRVHRRTPSIEPSVLGAIVRFIVVAPLATLQARGLNAIRVIQVLRHPSLVSDFHGPVNLIVARIQQAHNPLPCAAIVIDPRLRNLVLIRIVRTSLAKRHFRFVSDTEFVRITNIFQGSIHYTRNKGAVFATGLSVSIVLRYGSERPILGLTNVIVIARFPDGIFVFGFTGSQILYNRRILPLSVDIHVIDILVHTAHAALAIGSIAITECIEFNNSRFAPSAIMAHIVLLVQVHHFQFAPFGAKSQLFATAQNGDRIAPAQDSRSRTVGELGKPARQACLAIQKHAHRVRTAQHLVPAAVRHTFDRTVLSVRAIPATRQNADRICPAHKPKSAIVV